MPGQNVCELPECAPGELKDVSIEILCAEARAQEANFVRGEPSEDAAGVELFRRAIADGDEEAWEAVVALYRGLLIAQSARQVVRSLVVEDAGFCVDRAFQRFWRATRARGIHEFQDLASILKYLKMCLASVLLDEARARRWFSVRNSRAYSKAWLGQRRKLRVGSPGWRTSTPSSAGWVQPAMEAIRMLLATGVTFSKYPLVDTDAIRVL